eukprot:CAMPEP_0197495402 /NCGR_PEP_ID=MMETSP1311-20131121/36363_1 /TAXON_ID=464262 /ORGANISM="Genus nov. species nov., Strain RCC856" /LENGTH=33 /DNA_ID= /DNA_START= /DNA_END= /DNA_ORIENTATION=
MSSSRPGMLVLRRSGAGSCCAYMSPETGEGARP